MGNNELLATLPEAPVDPVVSNLGGCAISDISIERNKRRRAKEALSGDQADAEYTGIPPAEGARENPIG